MVIPLQAGLILIYYLFFLGWSYDANAPDGKFFFLLFAWPAYLRSSSKIPFI